MKFKNWILTEGKYEWRTTKISRAIVNTIKNVYRNIDKGELLYHGDPKAIEDLAKVTPKPIQGLEDENINILVLLFPSDHLTIGGSYVLNRKMLKIKIFFQRSNAAFLFNMQKMIEMLKGTIRHELEHSGQSKEDLELAANANTNIWKDAKSVIGYFANPAEVAAHVSQLYKQAKMTKSSFLVRMREYLDMIAKTLERSEINPADVIPVIEKAWLKYANQRFKIK